MKGKEGNEKEEKKTWEKEEGIKKQGHVEKLQVSILITLPRIFPRYHHAWAQHHNLTVNQPFGDSS